MTTNNSRQQLIAIASVIILALLGVIAFLLVNNINKGKELEAQTISIQEKDQLTDSLETQYNQAIIELDQMKGTNAELNAIIDQQKAELSTQKDKIAGLIRNKKDLSKARREIKNLTDQVEQYVAQIEQLQSENEELTSSNMKLTEDLSQQRMQNEDLQTAKAALVSEKQELETERSKLAKKVTFASVVKVKDVDVTGYKIRKSGRLSKKRYARNVDQLELCFSTTINRVTPASDEAFYVRIINPVGETIAVDERGSGVLKSREDESEVRYTRMLEHEYENDEEQICMTWKDDGNGFLEGNYKVEVYNKGYLAGSGEFRLK